MDLQEYIRKRNTKFFRYPGTRRYLGNNKTKIWDKNIKENNISSISNQLGYLYLAIYPYPTCRYAPGKYAL
jgi:hypothetical protein